MLITLSGISTSSRTMTIEDSSVPENRLEDDPRGEQNKNRRWKRHQDSETRRSEEDRTEPEPHQLRDGQERADGHDRVRQAEQDPERDENRSGKETAVGEVGEEVEEDVRLEHRPHHFRTW